MVIGKAMVLGEIADAAADGGGAGRFAEQCGAALGQARDAEEDLDERGLAGAVLAEQAEDLALLHGQRQLAQGLDAPIVLDQVSGDDDCHVADSALGCDYLLLQ